MTIHIDDSSDFPRLAAERIELHMDDFPGKSKREVAEILYCEEIVAEIEAAGYLEKRIRHLPSVGGEHGS